MLSDRTRKYPLNGRSVNKFTNHGYMESYIYMPFGHSSPECLGMPSCSRRPPHRSTAGFMQLPADRVLWSAGDLTPAPGFLCGGRDCCGKWKPRAAIPGRRRVPHNHCTDRARLGLQSLWVSRAWSHNYASSFHPRPAWQYEQHLRIAASSCALQIMLNH